jgi:multicomponent Na+:H+ antiporter subunit E
MNPPRRSVDASRNELRSSVVRAAGFIGFWLVLCGFDLLDLLVGALAAGMATWASLRLLPPGQWSLSPVALIGLAVRFLHQSVVAGLDVAWRALDPRLPVRPGFVVYRPHLPPGPMRNAFSTMTSLLPGTLPSGSDESGGLVIHCLDVTQPVAEQLAEQEACFMRAFAGAHGHE